MSSLRVPRGLKRPSARNLSKLIFTPNQKDLRPLQNFRNERTACCYFLPEFRRRHQHNIELASEGLLRRGEHFGELSPTDLSDHHEVDVAARVISPSGEGTEEERQRD